MEINESRTIAVDNPQQSLDLTAIHATFCVADQPSIQTVHAVTLLDDSSLVEHSTRESALKAIIHLHGKKRWNWTSFKGALAPIVSLATTATHAHPSALDTSLPTASASPGACPAARAPTSQTSDVLIF